MAGESCCRPRQIFHGLHFNSKIGGRGSLIAHRVSWNGSTLALFRVDDWWDWIWAGFGEFNELFGHLRAADVELACDDPAAYVRNEMLKNPQLFGRGDFIIEPKQPNSKRVEDWHFRTVKPDAVTDQLWVEFNINMSAIIPMRASSPPDSGRVKWYRKLARQKQLPPVFLYYHAGLISWLIVDGHDRLLAARLEELPSTFVVISSVRRIETSIDHKKRLQLEDVLALELEGEPSPRKIDGINKRLISMYQEVGWTSHTRGVVLRGGIDGWVAECSRLDLPRVFVDANSGH